MKKFLIAAATGLLFAHAGTAHADLTIVQKMDGMGQNMESTAKFKGTKTRVDAGPNMTIIMDLKSGEMEQINDAQKSYLKIPMQLMQSAVDSMKKTQGSGAQKPQLTATGKKDTISGYAAEEYTATIAGSKLSLWLTKAIPDYEKTLKEMSAAFSQGPMAAMMQNFGLDMASLPGFPIRTVNELQPGQTITTTVESINTKPLADADFQVPAGYKEISMPTLTPPAGATAPAPGPHQ